jgi:TPP-dependent 2-oxoacid decarboxylase
MRQPKVLIIPGPAMENHTLMHHTLGTGEFGFVMFINRFEQLSLILLAACTTPW